MSTALIERSIDRVSEKLRAIGVELDLKSVLNDARSRIERAHELREEVALVTKYVAMY